MPLIKFPALLEVIGECWLDPIEVTSICPLRGTQDQLGKRGTPEDPIDLSQTVLIGCRVACAGITFDLATHPESMAEIVHIAHHPWPERVVSPRTALLPN